MLYELLVKTLAVSCRGFSMAQSVERIQGWIQTQILHHGVQGSSQYGNGDYDQFGGDQEKKKKAMRRLVDYIYLQLGGQVPLGWVKLVMKPWSGVFWSSG